MTMKCGDVKKILPDLIYEELPASEAARAWKHVALCPECKAEYEELAAALSAVRRAPEIEPPQHINTRVLAYAREEAERAVRGPAWNFLMRPGLAMAAMALLVASVAIVMWGMGERPGEPGFELAAAEGDRIEIEEYTLEKKARERGEAPVPAEEWSRDQAPAQARPGEYYMVEEEGVPRAMVPPPAGRRFMGDTLQGALAGFARGETLAGDDAHPGTSLAGYELGPDASAGDTAKVTAEDLDRELLARLMTGETAADEKEFAPARPAAEAPLAGREFTWMEPAGDMEARPERAKASRETASAPGPRGLQNQKAEKGGPSTADLVWEARRHEINRNYVQALAFYDKALRKMGWSPRREEGWLDRLWGAGDKDRQKADKVDCTITLQYAVEGAVRCHRKLGHRGEARDLEEWHRKTCPRAEAK